MKFRVFLQLQTAKTIFFYLNTSGVYSCFLSTQTHIAIGSASANSVESYNNVESYLRRTSRIYFDNVTLTIHIPCQHNNKCDFQ